MEGREEGVSMSFTAADQQQQQQQQKGKLSFVMIWRLSYLSLRSPGSFLPFAQ
jgi:hypothetical protein